MGTHICQAYRVHNSNTTLTNTECELHAANCTFPHPIDNVSRVSDEDEGQESRMVAVVQSSWHLLLFIHMKVRMASFQSFIDFLQHPLFRKQHANRTIIQQLELDIPEAEARNFREDDLLNLSTT